VPKQVSRYLNQQTGADEIIATAQVFDHAVRLHSFEIAVEIFQTPHSPRPLVMSL